MTNRTTARCIEARVHRQGRQDDTRIKDVEFTGVGTEFDCAVRIFDIIKTVTTNPLLKEMLRRVEIDEARHAAVSDDSNAYIKLENACSA